MKKKIIYFILGLFLVATFMSLNDIVSLFFGKESRLKKADFDDYANAGTAYALINDPDIMTDDIKERIYCSGWAFVETDERNDEKWGTMILKGRNHCYRTSDLSFRISSVQDDAVGWKNICGRENNYAITFSTVQLPDDVYEIYIYLEENENTKGIVDTGAGFRKNGIHMESFTDMEFCDTPDLEVMEVGFDHGWWDIYQEDTHLRIQGWQIKEGIPSEEFTYYVVFEGENGKTVTAKMPSKNHIGLGEDYGMEYVTSGFIGCIDYDQLPDASGYRYILAERDGVWYRTNATWYEMEEQHGND